MAIATCPSCGAKNRVEDRGPNQHPVCGRCGTALDAGASAGAGAAHPTVVTDATFAQIVQGAGATPVLVDCWAEWCGPCRQLIPILDSLAAEAAGRYVVAKLNIDENPATAQKFSIRSIPTMLIFKNGQLADTLVGLQPKAAIQKRLLAHT